MTPPVILQAAGAVEKAFTDLEVAYFVGGSVASSAYGVARSTLDVDPVADLREHHVDPLVARLSDACYIDAGMIRRALAQRSSFNLIHLDTMMKIDVFIQ